MNLRCCSITLLLLMAVALQSIAAENVDKRSSRRIQNYNTQGRFLTGLFNKFNSFKGVNKQKGNKAPTTIITSSWSPSGLTSTGLVATPITNFSPSLPITSPILQPGIVPSAVSTPCCEPTGLISSFPSAPNPSPNIPSVVTSNIVSPGIQNTAPAIAPVVSSLPATNSPVVINPVPISASAGTGSGVISFRSIEYPEESLKEDKKDDTEVQEPEVLKNVDGSSNANVNAETDMHNDDDSPEELNKIEESRGNGASRKQQIKRRRTQPIRRRNQNNIKKYNNKLNNRNIILQLQNKPLQNSNVVNQNQQMLMQQRRRQQLLLQKKRLLLQRRRKRNIMIKNRRRLLVQKRRRLQILNLRKRRGNHAIIIKPFKR